MILVVGINSGVEKLEKLREQRLVNSYIINGQLGRETYKHKEDAKVTKRATFGRSYLSHDMITFLM